MIAALLGARRLPGDGVDALPGTIRSTAKTIVATAKARKGRTARRRRMELRMRSPLPVAPEEARRGRRR
jgi:hypothetical protein